MADPDSRVFTLARTIDGAHSLAINAVAFSPGGSLLASASADQTIKLRDAKTGELKQTLERPKGYMNATPGGFLKLSYAVTGIAFSPDGTLLASTCTDRIVRIWDIQTEQVTKSLNGHLDTVKAVAISPDGKLLASASQDKLVKIWDFEGNLRHTLEGHTLAAVNTVAFSPDGTLASGGYDGTIKLWDPLSGQLIRTIEAHAKDVYSVVFAPDGKTLISASGDNTAKLWDVAPARLIRTLEGHTSSVVSLACSAAGIIATGSLDKTIKLWSLDGTLLQTCTGHVAFVTCLAFSPDGRCLASGSSSQDKSIRLWAR